MSSAQALYERHAFLLLQGLPRSSLVALDTYAARTDTHFEGFKLIPPGLHCLVWQAADYTDERRDALTADGLRSAMFRYLGEREVLLREYDMAADAWTAPRGAAAGTDVVVSREHLQSMDSHLAPYPLDSAPLWSSLTEHLAKQCDTLARVFSVDLSVGDATCDSFTPVAERDAAATVREIRKSHDAPVSTSVPVTLCFTPFTLSHSWPPNAHGKDRTRWSMDKTWLLADVMCRAAAAEETPPTHEPLLREFELTYLLFRFVNNAAALSHWTALIALFCRASTQLGAPGFHELHPAERDADEAPTYAIPQLEAHLAFLRVLIAQLKALPENCWVSELSSSEKQVLTDLLALRSNISRSLGAWAAQLVGPRPCEQPAPPHEQLLQAWRVLAHTCTRFDWDLDAELDEEAEADDVDEGEDAPVVVDL